MPKLKGKHAIRDLSYRPQYVKELDEQYVKELDEAGIEIVDQVTGDSKTDPDLISWVEYFRKVDQINEHINNMEVPKWLS